MIKKITLYSLLLAIGLTILSLPIFHPRRAQKPASDKYGSIVRLVRNQHTFCTGVVVSAHTIITASHCVLEESAFGASINTEPMEIRLDDNEPIGVRARAYGARVQLDQAVLYGNFEKFTARKYVTSVHELNKLAKYDRTLIACGYPMGGPLFCSKMYFQELYDFMWATKGLLLPGMSGGPVMLEDGTVVAINIAVGKERSLVSPIYNIDLEFRGEK